MSLEVKSTDLLRRRLLFLVFSLFPDDNHKNTIGNRTEVYSPFSIALCLCLLSDSFLAKCRNICSSNQFSRPVSAHIHRVERDEKF